MPSPILNNTISQFEINNIELFIRFIDSYSDNEFSDNIASDRSLSILAHYAVDKQDVGLLTKLKIRNFSLENNVLIDSRVHSPLSLAIKKMHLPTIKKLISFGVEVNSQVIDREIKAILMTAPQDVEKKELVRNIFNFMMESGFILNIKDRSFLISQDYQDLITQTQVSDNLLKDNKIIIEESNQQFFQNFFQSLSQCLEKYDDLDREITRGNRDIDKLGEIEINGKKIALNAFGLKRICDKIIIKKNSQSSFASCFSRICSGISSREIKLEKFLESKDHEDQLGNIGEKLTRLKQCLNSTIHIASYTESNNASRANSMEFRLSQESRRLSRQSFYTEIPLDIENSLIDPNRFDQNSIRLIEDRGLFLDSGDHQINPSTEAESFRDRNIFEENSEKDPEAESPNSKSIHRQSLRVNRGGNWQSMRYISREEKLESEIISNQRVLTRQNEIPNNLTRNISGIGLAPMQRSKSL
jgi:hypothetical protein